MFDALADPKIRAAAVAAGLGGGDDGMLPHSPSSDPHYVPPALSFSASSTAGLQSASQALRTSFFRINLCVSIIFNIILNVIIGYATMSSFDSEGLWTYPASPHANTSSLIYLDLPGTCVLVTFLTTLIISPTVKGKIKEGKIAPVPHEDLSRGAYRLFPVRVANAWARSFWLSLEMLILWAAPTVVGFGLACQAGLMSGPPGDPACQVSARWYVWGKAFFAGITAGFVYPLAMLSALNRRHLPAYTYQCYLQRQYQLQSFASGPFAEALTSDARPVTLAIGSPTHVDTYPVHGAPTTTSTKATTPLLGK